MRLPAILALALLPSLAAAAEERPPTWFSRPPAASDNRSVGTGRADTRIGAVLGALGELVLAARPATPPEPSQLEIGPLALTAQVVIQEVPDARRRQLTVTATLRDGARALSVRWVRDERVSGTTGVRVASRLEWVSEDVPYGELVDRLRAQGITLRVHEGERESFALAVWERRR